MTNDAKLKALEQRVRGLLREARAITDRAKAEGRAPTAAENTRLEELMNEADLAMPEIKSLREAGAVADGIRSKTGKATGWKSVAEALAKAGDGRRERRWAGRLADIDVKAPTITDMTDNATRTEPGVKPLLEDSRRFHTLFASSDPGNALHVESFQIESRGLASGTVERDPLSTAAKAEADITIGIESVDLKQFAITSGDVPNQAFRSVPALSRILQSALGTELDIALDAHAVAALMNSFPDVEASGSTLVEKLRHGKATLAARGVNGPLIAVIGDTEAAELDLILPDQLPSGFPFGIQIAVVPDSMLDGNAYLMGANALRKYKGSARLDVNPWSSFTTNESNLRLEYEALVVVEEASAILDLVGAS